MQVLHGEGLAKPTGPESCAAGGNGPGEAWTGERAGRVLSRENADTLRSADKVRFLEGHTFPRDSASGWDGSARSKTPSMPGNTYLGTWESPWPPAVQRGAAGRVGKSKDERPR